MYPALSVLKALGSETLDSLWVGGQGGMEAELIQRESIRFEAIPAAGVHGVGLRALPGNLARLLRGTFAARRILAQFKPDVIFFTGGYVAAPMAVAAGRVPVVLYVPDIEPGLALKFLARFADTIALTVEDSRKYFNPRKTTIVTGYPTRPELEGWTREKGMAHLGLSSDLLTLLVTGGSKGARTLNQPVFAHLPELLQMAQVVHITGNPDWSEAQAVQHALPSQIASRYHPMPFLHEMGAALVCADLAISRAGASVLGEYPLFGVPAILVPYQYAWRYQKVNADYLTQRGAAITLAAEELPGQLLPTLQALLAQPEKLSAMRAAMRSLHRPLAARSIANLLRQYGQPALHMRILGRALPRLTKLSGMAYRAVNRWYLHRYLENIYQSIYLLIR